MRILVISASLGTTAEKTITKQEGYVVDFVFYNDNNFPKRTASFTPRMNAKILKMLAWMTNPGYDYYLWMDSNFSISRNDVIKWFMNNIGDSDALFFKHPERSSINSEALFMRDRAKAGDSYLIGRIDGEPIVEQALRYIEAEGYNDSLLIAASSFFYKNTERMRAALKEWYFETCIGSIRDQLSLPYVLKEFDIDFKLMEENVFNLKYLK